MKYRCKICGHIYDEEKEGVKFADLPADWKCPTCGAPKSAFVPVEEKKSWAAEHVIGIAKEENVPEDIREGLRSNFIGDCTEVGMYLAMARAAFREGYAEIGLFYEQAAREEADHASRFAETLGEMVSPSTKTNLEMSVDAEYVATEGKFELAKKAKQLNLDAIHDSVHEMARDEARHGKAFEGLLARYFGEKK